MYSHFVRRLFLGSLLLLLAILGGCGGGGGGSVAAAPSDALAIAGFSPSSAGVGDVVTVTGTAFTTVTSARVSGVNATFTIDSGTRLHLTVPAGATSGRIELASATSAVLSTSDLAIVDVPQVSSVTPTSIKPPARITVTGTHLDLVQQARLGNSVLTIAAQSPTNLALDVPANASTAFLTLVANDGVARQSAVQVSVTGSIVVTSFTPTSIVFGATLTINGSNLDRATAVEFAGGSSSPIASRTGSTAITTVVPATALSGPVTVVGNIGDRVTSADSLTVFASIQVDGSATYRVAAGGAVTIAGTGLIAVSGVTVGSSAAVVTAQSDAQLVFTAPPGVNCGPITLLSPAQPSVPAGSLVVGAGCTIRSAGVEFAQVLAQSAGDQYQRIVPGKELLVRAYVVAETAGNGAPTVRLTGSVGATTVGSLSMTGPATVPVLAGGAPLPDALRYDEAQSYNAILPATWVAPGLSVRIDIDAEQRFGTPIAVNATPAVGTQTNIDLVLVPLVSGTNVPQMPDLALVADELVRRMPVQRDRVTVSMRAPYTLTSATDGVDTDADWTNALSELETLRRNEAPSRQYFGMVRPIVSAGTAGIGYVNRVGASSPNLSAMGWDASRSSWRRTVTHELGHNFSRQHAPCGGAANPDANYPYAGGALSATPLFESLLDDIVSPANQFDVMGYCSGSWFSDYNLREVQRFLEARPQPALVTVQAAAQANDLVVVAGRITADGVSFAPVQHARGVAPVAASGAYRLRVLATSGATFEIPFDAVEVDHALASERHFFVTLASPGPLAGLEVASAGVLLPQRADSRVRPQGQAGVRAAPSIQWRESGTHLEVTWDASTTRYLSVTHQAGVARLALAVNLTGGHAVLDAGALPRGGELEFSLSDGLNAHLIVVAR
ncbi:MAG TPA: IPT/TIG domain-containing protein [Burkholderiaceae bacterium]|nr:IPT/TIG domain-containing protein [Burkholderiaceae bacterium]